MKQGVEAGLDGRAGWAGRPRSPSRPGYSTMAVIPFRFGAAASLLPRFTPEGMIEHALAMHPAVADAGVIGVPDSVRGQNTKAFVVLTAGRSASEPLKHELIEHCRGKIATYKLPREIEFVESVPRAPGPAGPGTGKLLRGILREREDERQR